MIQDIEKETALAIRDYELASDSISYTQSQSPSSSSGGFDRLAHTKAIIRHAKSVRLDATPIIVVTGE